MPTKKVTTPKKSIARAKKQKPTPAKEDKLAKAVESLAGSVRGFTRYFQQRDERIASLLSQLVVKDSAIKEIIDSMKR